MALTSKQKEYIRKNARYFTIETLASDLGIERKIIEKYLKKIWRRDKYLKYISKDKKNDEPGDQKEVFVIGEFILNNIFIFAGLLFLVLAVFINSLGNGFVSDDVPMFVNNPNLGSFKYVYDLGLIGSPENFFYFLGHTLGGSNPAFYRIFNILFHLGSVWIVFGLASTITKKQTAIFAAALFAMHPILTEAVTWISGLPYALGSFFVLLSLWTYILKKNIFWPLLFFFLASLSLEKTMVLPFILVLYEFSFGGMQKIKQNWKKLAMFFGVSFVWILFYLNKVSMRISAIESMNYQDHGGLYNPLIQVPIAIGNYLKLIFWPDKLTLYHTEMSFNTVQYITYLVVFIIFLGIIFWGWKKNKQVFFWLSFFFITLLPTFTPLKIAWIVAERYVYLGSIGIFVVVAMFFDWLYEKSKERNKQYKYAVVAIFTVIILALSVRTIVRNMDWKNEDTLWIATAKSSPSGPNIHNNLGDVYARRGDMERSVEEFKKAIEINPRYADAYHNLANDYQNMGKTDLAIENYQKALEFNPNLWQSNQNLASIYFDRGDFQKALDHIQKALVIDPQNKNLQENLQVIQARMQ